MIHTTTKGCRCEDCVQKSQALGNFGDNFFWRCSGCKVEIQSKENPGPCQLGVGQCDTCNGTYVRAPCSRCPHSLHEVTAGFKKLTLWMTVYKALQDKGHTFWAVWPDSNIGPFVFLAPGKPPRRLTDEDISSKMNTPTDARK